MSTTKITAKEIHLARSDFFLKERKDSECFPVSNAVRPAFLCRRASRNCREGQEETLLDGVAYESAIVDFFSFLLPDLLTRSKVLNAICN